MPKRTAKPKRKSKPKRLSDRGNFALDHLLNAGARAIYEWREQRNPWSKASNEKRAAYRARMQELVNVLAFRGYEIVHETNRQV